MPKAEKGTPKDIGIRIKAKGLQKLKFYCQMCEKQCRDANGFKCHMTSETHLRNMKIFSQNASGIMDSMSKEFERTYLETLRRRHGTKRVNANNVYQEQIADKEHIHMNSTKWASLADFVQYLGRTSKCVVDETERGWYIQYIERDAGIIARHEAQKKRVEAEKAAEDRYSKQMEVQRVEAAKMLDRAGGELYSQATNLNWEGDHSISLSLGIRKSVKRSFASIKGKSVFDDNDESEAHESSEKGIQLVMEADKSMLDPLKNNGKVKQFNQSSYQHSDDPNLSNKKTQKDSNDTRSENWIHPGILVRITSKKLASGKYYMRKAVLEKVLPDKFTAEVEVLDSGPDERDGGDILRLDQMDLETVIPKVGKMVRILNGRHSGKSARLITLYGERRQAKLEMVDGTILEPVDYQDISKIAS